MLDVVACARLLLTELYPGRLTAYAVAIGVAEEDALAWVLFTVALHDLGKLTPPFQAKAPHRMDALRSMGLDFPDGEEPHGSMSAILVPAELERLGCPTRLARGLAAAVAAHHGDFATTAALNNLEDDPRRNAGRRPIWAELRRDLADALCAITGVNRARAPRIPSSAALRHSLYADLAGLTTVADWLGSNADVFRYVEPPQAAEAYLAVAADRAKISLREAGFRRPPRPSARSFEGLFSPRTPWPLHEAVHRVLNEVGPGSLVIIEAPMGEGKTEAALLLYDTLASRDAEGLYFALPTQATANQILGRVEGYLARSFPGEAHGLHLVHGGAGLSDRYGTLKTRALSTRSIGDISRGRDDQGPMADAWFARSKRALLAPIAVGTVDQALLGVLRSKWHFLRLHGLARKVFVVDEVHAYDTFTAEILARLCTWLRSLGSTVVLLSATLASPQRARLLKAYGVDDVPTPVPYPRITLAREGRVRAESFEARRPPIEVALEWRDEAELPRAVAEAVREGGCVAWIVNTVARAQASYLVLSEMRERGELPAHVAVSLLHARFPFAARQARERAAEDAFGPNKGKARPRAAILIGTQVLEQSLDLDFDLMVTDLAPVDLVLQRAGRLHRHDRDDRPAALESRRLWIARPDKPEALDGPTFGSSKYVYDESILLRSWLALSDRPRVVLPTDIEPLVESVYAPAGERTLPTPIAARLAELDGARENQARSDCANADRRELPHPDETNPFGNFSARFDEEDPNVHKENRALTRLGEETITVVPVVMHGHRLVLATDPAQNVDINTDVLPFRDVLAIARQALSISRKAVVFALLRDDPPRCFQRSGHLRYHRLLRLDDAGTAVVGGTQLRLDPALGLVVGDLHPLAEPS